MPARGARQFCHRALAAQYPFAETLVSVPRVVIAAVVADGTAIKRLEHRRCRNGTETTLTHSAVFPIAEVAALSYCPAIRTFPFVSYAEAIRRFSRSEPRLDSLERCPYLVLIAYPYSNTPRFEAPIPCSRNVGDPRCHFATLKSVDGLSV